MRPLLVVFPTKTIEAKLLLGKARAWRSRCFGFKSFVHSLMLAVLLRLTWFNSLWTNAELDPPHRKLRKSPDGTRTRKRNPVIRPYHQREAKFLEMCLVKVIFTGTAAVELSAVVPIT